MTVGNSSTQRLRQPIRIDSTQNLLFVPVVVIQHISGGKQSGTAFIFQFLGSIHQIIIRKVRHGNTDIPAVIQGQRTRFRFLGLEYNHPVGGLRTIHRRTGSIFQYRDGLHSLRIQIDNPLQGRFKTIQNKQGHIGTIGIISHHHLEISRVAGPQLHISTQPKFRQFIRVRTMLIVLYNMKTRIEYRQCLQQIIRVESF